GCGKKVYHYQTKNNMKTRCMILLAAFISIGTVTIAQSAKQTAIREIAAAEKAFNDMAAAKGIKEAFVYFAAEDVIIKRGNDSLIYGRAGVGNFYAKDFIKN